MMRCDDMMEGTWSSRARPPIGTRSLGFRNVSETENCYDVGDRRGREDGVGYGVG